MNIAETKGSRTLLQRYLVALSANPLRTKAITTGTLCFLQEVLGSTIAGSPPQRPSKDASYILHALAALNVDLKAFKMAAYGFFVSAPMGHYLTGVLQKAFIGRTDTRAKIAQIFANSLFVAPIQAAVFLSSMAIISGAKTVDEIIKTVKAGFFSVLRVSWVVSPLSMMIAQKFIPLNLWVPFFNSVQFVLGTFFNVRVKQMRLAAVKKARRDMRENKDDED